MIYQRYKAKTPKTQVSGFRWLQRPGPPFARATPAQRVFAGYAQRVVGGFGKNLFKIF